MKAHLFLRKRTFEGLLSAPPEGPTSGGPYDPATEAGKALLTLARIAQREFARTGSKQVIYTRPVTAQLLALAQAPREFMTYQRGTQSFGAWMEFLRTYLPNPPNLSEISAPWPFPPSKDGKIYTATAPPTQSLMSAEDEAEVGRVFGQ